MCELNPELFIPILNSAKVRGHLIEHELFDERNVKVWIEGKLKVDSVHGCMVRAVIVNDELAGWCGIQLEKGKYELAIVLDEKKWGLGRAVFFNLLEQAGELGHKEVYIHLLNARPGYKFLTKMAGRVFESELLGNKFLTYQISI